jgi:hypothetical protein
MWNTDTKSGLRRSQNPLKKPWNVCPFRELDTASVSSYTNLALAYNGSLDHHVKHKSR